MRKRGKEKLNNIDFLKIEQDYSKLLQTAKEYMKNIKDFEHNINHMNDVVFYTKELLNNLNIDVNTDVNTDVCIISAYWHDVGRINTDEGHEKLSAEMLKEEMKKLNYDDDLIKECYKAIENHKWNMQPQTIEGLVLKDADKLAWLGFGRWMECLNNHQKLDSIIDLLPKLRNEILYFDESKKIYDRYIIELVKLLYNRYL